MGSVDVPSKLSAVNTRQEGIPYFTPKNSSGEALEPHASQTPTLFRPLRIRHNTFKNRIFVAPMCMYSAEPDPSSPAVGALTDYHVAHLGAIAMKGASLVIVEATGVQPNGRITPNDSGLWQHDVDSEQFKGLKRVTDFVHSQGALAGIQLAHAGRKGSTTAPWVARRAGVGALRSDEDVGGWPTNVVGPSGGEDQAWKTDGIGYWPPREMSTPEVEELVQDFAKSAVTAVRAGIDVIEIHAAHGYLLNEFLSPVTNKRTDKYGGSFENRIRLVIEIIEAVRKVIPQGMPLFLRVSATEWLENSPVAAKTGSWDVASTIRLAKLLPDLGVDLLDVSSGGNHKDQRIEPHTNYQIRIAGEIRKAVDSVRSSSNQKLLIGAVGLITEAQNAKQIVEGADLDVHEPASAADADTTTLSEEAQTAEKMVKGLEPMGDAILIARQFLREPEWVLKVAEALGVKVTTPVQFGRVFPEH